MKEDGVTQNFLAKKYGIKQSSLSRFLNEERELPERCFLALFFLFFMDSPLPMPVSRTSQVPPKRLQSTNLRLSEFEKEQIRKIVDT